MWCCVCHDFVPQFGKVYKGVWRGSVVAVKAIILPAALSNDEKREKMVGGRLNTGVAGCGCMELTWRVLGVGRAALYTCMRACIEMRPVPSPCSVVAPRSLCFDVHVFLF